MRMEEYEIWHCLSLYGRGVPKAKKLNILKRNNYGRTWTPGRPLVYNHYASLRYSLVIGS